MKGPSLLSQWGFRLPMRQPRPHDCGVIEVGSCGVCYAPIPFAEFQGVGFPERVDRCPMCLAEQYITESDFVASVEEEGRDAEGVTFVVERWCLKCSTRDQNGEDL